MPVPRSRGAVWGICFPTQLDDPAIRTGIHKTQISGFRDARSKEQWPMITTIFSYTKVRCGAVQCGPVRCGAMQCGAGGAWQGIATWYNALQGERAPRHPLTSSRPPARSPRT